MALDFPSSPTSGQVFQAKGQPTYKWVSPTWRVVDSGLQWDDDAQRIFDAFTVPPTDTRKNLIETLVKALKTANVWTKLDGLYLLAAADAQAASINWKNPGTNTATLVNAPAFTVDQGYLGASGKYVDTNFNPFSAPSPRFTQDNACLFAWSWTPEATSNGGIIRQGSGSGGSGISPYQAYNGCLTWFVTGGGINSAITAGNGLSSANRSASTASQVYKNGALFASTTAGSSPVATGTFLFGVDLFGGYFTGGRIGGGGFGGSLDATEQLALYNAINTYMLAVQTARVQAAADAIANAFTVPPTVARKSAIQTFVTALLPAGVWDKLDTFYGFAAADAQAAKVNWRQPGTYNATEVNAPVFTPDQGFTGASTKYLDSNFNPVTAPSPKYVQDSASVSGWSLSDIDNGNSMALQSVGWNFIQQRATGGAWVALNSSSQISGSNTNGLGLFTLTRTSSSALLLYRNGALLHTHSNASVAVSNAVWKFSNVWPGTIAVAHIGQQLSAADNTVLYNATLAYLNAVDAFFDVDAAAIWRTFATPPTLARKTLINSTVVALKAAGLWSKFDTLYLFAAADAQAGTVNWIKPGTYNATVVNAAAFMVDRGYTGQAGGYIDTGFNATTAPSPKFVQNSASLIGWSLTASALTGGSMVGNNAGTSNVNVISPSDGANGMYDVNTFTAITTFANTNGSGLYVASRTASNLTTLYKNGSAISTEPLASTALINQNVAFIHRYGSYWLGQVSAGGVGAGLTATDNANLYAILNDYLDGVGAVASYDTESKALFTAMTVMPVPQRKLLIDSTVKALKAASIWTKLDALYTLAAADSQAALLNWKAPGTFNGTLVNAPTFTADVGFTGAATKYIDTGFNPTTAPTPQFVQNSSSILAWSSSVAADSIFVGTAAAPGTSGESYFLAWYPGGGNYFFARVSSSADQTILSPFSTGLGFWVGSRTGASATDFYRNGGASFLTSAVASAAPANANLRLMSRGGQYSTGDLSIAGFGSKLTAGESTNLYHTLSNYMLGLPGVLIDAQADAVAKAFTVPPTLARRSRINDLVVALKQGGIWDKLDALYVFSAADSQSALINWKAPGTYNVTNVNSLALTVDYGFTGAGSKYLDSNFNLLTAPSPKYALNNAFISVYSASDIISATDILQALGTGGTTQIRIREGAANYNGGVNSVSYASGATPSAAAMLTFTRSSATSYDVYRSGVFAANHVMAAQSAFTSGTVLFSYGWPGIIASAAFGSALNAAENLVLFNALAAYRAGIAADRIAESFTTPPTAARKTAIQTCVQSLITAGVWDKLDALYLFAAADSQAGLVNWKTPGTYNGTLVNSPVFVVDQGFTGAATKYVETSFNPSTAPTPNFVQNSGSVFAWGLSTGAATEVTFGSGASTQDSFIYPRYSGDVTHYGVNQSSNTTVTSTDGSGLFMVSRTGASAIQAYRNGAAHGAAGNTASAAPGNTTFRMMSRNGVNNYTGTITCAGWGSSLSAGEATALYNALRAYMTGVGVP